jgi:hypothetical protein
MFLQSNIYFQEYKRYVDMAQSFNLTSAFLSNFFLSESQQSLIKQNVVDENSMNDLKMINSNVPQKTQVPNLFKDDGNDVYIDRCPIF